MRSHTCIPAGDVQARTRDALTELHVYALVLDDERERIEDRIAELRRTHGQVDELRELRRRRTEIGAQLALLSRTIGALRSVVDPSGQNL
ncbi:MAG TPA: hypothetical protein VEF89_20340 [Solirubrobacteraceae bacterium]|nr:hypothetical protein [Solirubrobacteraceae bacterium]